MKEVKTFIIVEIIIAILKVIAGLLCNSYTMIASALFEVMLIISSLFVLKQKENKKYKGIVSSIIGFLFVLLGLGMIFLSVISKIQKLSWFILLFVFIILFIRYITGCFYTNMNFQKKNGIIGYSTITSNTDFYTYGLVIGSLVLSKLSKFVEIFKYADTLGVILVVLLIFIKGYKIVKRSFKCFDGHEIDLESYNTELNGRSEIKKLVSININYFGGFRKAKCNLILNNNVTMIDLNTFVVSLQDYLLKIADVAEVKLVEEKDMKPKKPKVRSLKQDARNSRSGNSKTNTNKKNTTKKNKKR